MGEYRPLQPVLESLGIEFRHPCPYTHQQNEKSKRKHRHISELGITLLASANLPQKIWRDAFVTAVYLINRLPTPSLQNVTPFQVLFKTSPDYKFLKTFGCSCFPYLRPYNSSKLQYRSSKCLFIGYSPKHKGYRCLHPTGRLYIARTMVFNEKEFPYNHLFDTSLVQTSTPISPSLFTPPLLPTPNPINSASMPTLSTVTPTTNSLSTSLDIHSIV